uniref:Uncharacterized protein n=1 Tax=Taeniopygia guttata TaxID=59729 RepID=A0A674HRF8_TAEGU
MPPAQPEAAGSTHLLLPVLASLSALQSHPRPGPALLWVIRSRLRQMADLRVLAGAGMEEERWGNEGKHHSCDAGWSPGAKSSRADLDTSSQRCSPDS